MYTLHKTILKGRMWGLYESYKKIYNINKYFILYDTSMIAALFPAACHLKMIIFYK